MYLQAGFSEQELDTAEDRFVESMLIYGDEQKIQENLLQLLAMEIDELSVNVLSILDKTREEAKLAKIGARILPQ
jgi:hypothetical protein